MTGALRAVAAVVLLLTAAGMAASDVTQWYASDPVEFIGWTPWSTELKVPKFDVTLGTLSSVECAFTAGAGGFVTFTAPDGIVEYASGSLSARISLNRPGGGEIGMLEPTVVFSLENVPAPGGSYTWTSPGVTLVSGGGLLAGDLSAFCGDPGTTVSLPVSATATSTMVRSSDPYAFFTGAGAKAQVRYHYTTDAETTPELPSSALLLLGALPVALAWRRRKAT